MKILILEDEQRNAMRLIRLLNDIDTTFHYCPVKVDE